MSQGIRSVAAAVVLVAAGCASASRGARPLGVGPAMSPVDRALVFQTLAVYAASDRRAAMITAIAVRGDTGERPAHAVALRVPVGNLDEDWPASDVGRGLVRWSFRVVPRSACRDPEDWPYRRSPECNTDDGACVGASLDRWTTNDDCFAAGEAVLPVGLVRAHGVAVPSGLPRLTRHGDEWGIVADGAPSDVRPIVLVDDAPDDTGARVPRLRIVSDWSDVHVDRARSVAIAEARALFTAFYESRGLDRDDAERSAALVFRGDVDPREPLATAGELGESRVLLLVPVTADELDAAGRLDIGDATLCASRAGVIRWVDGIALEPLDERTSAVVSTDPHPVADDMRWLWTADRLVSHCSLAARDATHRPVVGRVVLTLCARPTRAPARRSGTRTPTATRSQTTTRTSAPVWPSRSRSRRSETRRSRRASYTSAPCPGTSSRKRRSGSTRPSRGGESEP